MVGHGALLISGYISWMSNHRPDLRETCWQVSSSSTYNSYNIVCTWLGLAMAMEICDRICENVHSSQKFSYTQ